MLKGCSEPFLSLSIAHNVISCRKVAQNTQILKIAKFAIEITSEITKKNNKKNDLLNRDLLKFGMVYKRWYLVNPHVQTVQNIYGKEG